MTPSRKLEMVSAEICIVSAVLLAIVSIYGIWMDVLSVLFWKAVGTLFILFLLSGFVHALSQGLRRGAEQKCATDKTHVPRTDSRGGA